MQKSQEKFALEERVFLFLMTQSADHVKRATSGKLEIAQNFIFLTLCIFNYVPDATANVICLHIQGDLKVSVHLTIVV